MTTAERSKLKDIQNRATHTGIQSIDTVFDSSTHVKMTTAERSKLKDIDENATKNDNDAQLRDRATHTGTQSADTIVDGITNAAFTKAEKAKLAVLDTVKPPAHFHDNETINNLSYDKLINIPTSFVPIKHSHNMSDITLGNLDASRITESSTKQFVTSAEKDKIYGSEQAANRGVPNGYVPLDGNGKINPSYLGSMNSVDVFTPVDFDAMLLLSSAKPGDTAFVQDSEKTYRLVGLPSSDPLNWKEQNSAAGVISINGLTGAVSMSSDHLPEGTINKYFTEAREDKIKKSIDDAKIRLDIVEAAISNTSLTRADKYLANQNVVKMIYNSVGKLSKVRYNTDSDTDYEVLTYNSEGKLSNVAHFINGILRGNTTLIYGNGRLVAAPYIEV